MFDWAQYFYLHDTEDLLSESLGGDYFSAITGRKALKMAEKKTKTISYHRAEYNIENPQTINLGICIKQATDNLKTAIERTIPRSGGQFIRLAMYKTDDDHGHYLHLTADTPGEAASIVPKVDPKTTTFQVATTPPPAGAEFMDGDAFVYVKGNHICVCATTLKVGAVAQFFYQFFDAANIRKDADQFHFVNAPDAARLSRIANTGVKSIELKTSLYSATLDYNKRKGQVLSVFLPVSKFFKAIFGSEHDVTEDALRVAVELSSDRRARGITVGQKRLNDVAVKLLEAEQDDDDFVIVLNNKEKIKPGEIFLKTTVEIEVKGKSVDRDQAWGKLLEYYKNLVKSGAFSH